MTEFTRAEILILLEDERPRGATRCPRCGFPMFNAKAEPGHDVGDDAVLVCDLCDAFASRSACATGAGAQNAALRTG
jgi:hypothetical protein